MKSLAQAALIHALLSRRKMFISDYDHLLYLENYSTYELQIFDANGI